MIISFCTAGERGGPRGVRRIFLRNPASSHTTTAARQRWKIPSPRGKADEASRLHQELSNSLKIRRGKDKLKNRMEVIEDDDSRQPLPETHHFRSGDRMPSACNPSREFC